jgi:RNA polymerase sigma-70 factor (ECF subfamily)
MLPMQSIEAAAETPAELAERIRSGGDGEAEARLVARYAGGVRSLLARHTRSVEEAEDLFQETFCLAAAKLRAGELREPSKLPGFLARLARHLATEHYRKAARRRTEVDSDKAEAGATAAAGQLGELLRGEEAALVRRVLDELSTGRDREILFRFYIGEEDKDEIAAELGLSGLQFNRVLHRARQRYKALYVERLAARGRARAEAAVRALFAVVLAAGASVRLLGSLSG